MGWKYYRFDYEWNSQENTQQAMLIKQFSFLKLQSNNHKKNPNDTRFYTLAVLLDYWVLMVNVAYLIFWKLKQDTLKYIVLTTFENNKKGDR